MLFNRALCCYPSDRFNTGASRTYVVSSAIAQNKGTPVKNKRYYIFLGTRETKVIDKKESRVTGKIESKAQL